MFHRLLVKKIINFPIVSVQNVVFFIIFCIFFEFFTSHRNSETIFYVYKQHYLIPHNMSLSVNNSPTNEIKVGNNNTIITITNL